MAGRDDLLFCESSVLVPLQSRARVRSVGGCKAGWDLRDGGTPRAPSEPSYLQAYMTRCADRLHPRQRNEHVDSLILALIYYQRRLGLYVSRLGYEATSLV